MNKKHIIDAALNFSKSVQSIQDFFVKDTKHLEYFVQEEIKEIYYVFLSVKGLLIGYKAISGEEHECRILWEPFIDYVYTQED